MRNDVLRVVQMAGIALFTAVLLGVGWIATVTHNNSNISPASRLLYLAVEHHVVLMVLLIVVAIAYGYLWSLLSYNALRKTRKASRSILDTVLLFLNVEERAIIDYLVAHHKATQADISRLGGMNRVKAHRALQKMQEKNLVEIESFGKVRKVALKENIADVLGSG